METGTITIRDCPACNGSHLLAPGKYERRERPAPGHEHIVQIVYTCSVHNVRCLKVVETHPLGRAMVRTDHTDTERG